MRAFTYLIGKSAALLFLASCTFLPNTHQDPIPPPNMQTDSIRVKKTSEAPDTVSPGIETSGPTPDLNQMGALQNLSDIITEIGLSPFHQRGLTGKGVRIAILDNGFLGWQQALGKRLPQGTTLDNGIENSQAQTAHGTRMAEIAYAVARGSLPGPLEDNESGPQIKLYNTNGFSNFEHAVKQVILDRVDIVLYSQVWEYGGNGDGQGFINKLVNEVVDQDILWINAAGNNGASTYQTPVRSSSEGLALLPYDGQYVRLQVTHDGTPVRVVLSWNDFNDSPEHKTAKDLDLRLSDCTGKKLKESALIQSGENLPSSQEGYSAYAREIIKTTLNQGVYCLSVPIMTRNFDGKSTLRLTADGFGVSFLDASVGGQLLIPADNPRVLVIGASDVSYSATGFLEQAAPTTAAAMPQSPELKLNSQVIFGPNESYAGTSAAAAIAAGALATLRGVYGKSLNSLEVHRRITGEQLLSGPQGRWLPRAGGFVWDPPSFRLSAPF